MKRRVYHRCWTLFPALVVAWLTGQALAQPAGVGIEPYPGSEVNRMGDRARFNGRELRMYYFKTEDEPEKVIEYYRRRWEAAGQIVAINRTGNGGLAVGYVDLRDGRTRTVALVRQAGLTIGFPAVTSGIPLPLSNDPAVAGGVPVHPKAEGLSVYESLEQGATFKTVNYSDSASVEDNEAFYLREMGRRGYSLTNRHQKDDSVMIEFQQGKKKLNVTLAWVSQYGRCSVFAVTNILEETEREDER